MAGKNCEGYPDPTANIAVGRVTRGEKKKRKKEAEKMYISIGNSRMDKKYNGLEMSYEEFVSRLSKTKYTAETMAQFKKLSKGKQDDIKDVGGFVLGKLKGGRRKRNA